MANINVFYQTPSHRKTRVATLPKNSCSLKDFCDLLSLHEAALYNILYETKVYRLDDTNLDNVNLKNNCHLSLSIPVLGGKGGFGSLLRAIGAQIEKTTNRDACRDLRGRRLRDVKREEELQKLLALQAKLQEEQKLRKQEKLDKLKSKSESYELSRPIQELVAMFDDHEYNKRRLDIADILDAAVDKGIINFQKRQSEGADANSEQRDDAEGVMDDADTADNLWLGIDDE